MQILWTPWRKHYITMLSKQKECIFCRAISNEDPGSNYVIYRSAHSTVMLNKYPYNNGHTMIAPIRHVPSIELLSDEELVDLVKTLNLVIKAVKMCYNPDGLNIGANIGKAAGAGVEGHLHIHVVPRWFGDANFMAVIARTKVIPESLDDTWRRLKECIDKASKA